MHDLVSLTTLLSASNTEHPPQEIGSLVTDQREQLIVLHLGWFFAVADRDWQSCVPSLRPAHTAFVADRENE